ncbi:MAG: hypothetical protein GF341_10395 [candidate division Zixibacteria bacterium]|nr:hypothetical protein [candidate division Zixibacteria bacterium]
MRKAVLVLLGAAVMMVAAVGSAGAQNIGVGVEYTGSSVTPDMLLPIKLGDGSLILEPIVGLSIISVDDPDEGSSFSAGTDQFGFTEEGTQFRVGLGLEKQTDPGNTSPLFGGFARVHLTSPESDNVDSWTDFVFGVYLGGVASLTDNMEIQGFWGPTFTMFGEKTDSDGDVFSPSVTRIDSRAGFKLRWFVFGS